MRRIFYGILLLCPLVAVAADAPLVIPSPQAARPRPAPPATTPLKPFTAFCWAFPGHLRHVKPMYDVSLAMPPSVMALTTRRMEEGTRVLLTREMPIPMLTHPNDVIMTPDGKPTKLQGPWLDFGPRGIADAFEDHLTKFKAAGGQIDFLVLDFEGSFSAWHVSPEWVAAVSADPRAPQLAERLGFNDFKLIKFPQTNMRETMRWDAVTFRMINDGLDLAVLQPLRRQFPKAGMSNWNCVAMPQDDMIPGWNGVTQYTLGDPPGTHQAPCHYGGAHPPQIKADWSKPFMQVLYAANVVRCGVRNSNHATLPWIGYRSYANLFGDTKNTAANTPFWEEQAWHVMLSGGACNIFLWNPPARGPAIAKTADGAVPEDNDAMETVMAEMEQAAKGSAVVAPLTPDAVPWDAGTIVSAGRLADGGALARVTFADKVDTVTFKLDGKEVVARRPAGKVGAWVRVP